MRGSNVALQTRCFGCHAHQTNVLGQFGTHNSRALNTRQDRWQVERQVGHFTEVGLIGVNSLLPIGQSFGKMEVSFARTNKTLGKSVATPLLEEVDHGRTQTSEYSTSQLIGHVGAYGT